MNFSNAAPLGLALFGLLLGMRHATDADHLIAVTTILSRERRLGAATRIGVAWGVGHTMTVLLVGGAIIVFKIAVPPRLGLAMELAVAVVLILLGASTLWGALLPTAARRRRPKPEEEPLAHAHSHAHGSLVHDHHHVHAPGDPSHADPSRSLHHDHLNAAPSDAAPPSRWPFVKALGTGLVHGLAGSSSIALLVLGAIPEPGLAVVYLVIFCVGVLLGMAMIATAIGVPFVVSADLTERLHGSLTVASGLLSVGFGLFMAYRIGLADGLFIAPPL